MDQTNQSSASTAATGRNVALYLRVSTAFKSKKGDANFIQNLEVQEQPLRYLIFQRGWTLHRVYSDGASGANESCSGLDALMKDARRGLFDVVVVWRLDRFARSIKQFVAVLEKFREMGIDFISHQELLDTSMPMGRTLFSIVAAMAQLERDIRAERTARISHARQIGNLPRKAVGRPRKILDREQIVRLRDEGWSWREIGRKARAGATTVRQVYKDAKKARDVHTAH